MNEYNEKISVCVVTGEENFITRIADVRGRELVLPYVDRSASFIGFNRDKLYFNRQDVPFLHKGSLGVWRWTVSPGRIESGKEWIDSEYLQRLSPIEVLDRSFNEAELKKSLKEGLDIPWGSHRRLILYDDGNMHGVLCFPSQLEQTPSGVRLKENVYVLPCYDLKETDLIDTEKVHGLGDYCLYHSLDLPLPTDVMIVRPLEHAVRQMLLEKLNKRFLMEHFGFSRKEAQQLQNVIEQLSDENIPEMISSVCSLPINAATVYWNKFQNNLSQYIRGEDISSEVLRSLLKEDDALRKRLKEEWQEDCQEELKQAKEEIKNAIDTCTARREGLKLEERQLDDELQKIRSHKQNELERIEQEIKDAEERLEKALEEADQAEQLHQENIEQYKRLSEESLRLVREKLSLARKEAAEFLSDLALFGAPGESVGTPIVQSVSSVPVSFSFQKGRPTEKKEDVQETIDVLDLLGDNLKATGAEHDAELAHFLFGAFHSRTHLLLTGPQGLAVADALSCTMTGHHVAVLDCSGEWDPSALRAVMDCGDTVIAVKHPFSHRWIDQLAPELDNTGKMWIFLHPYAEDLPLEPSGLYSYVFPLVLDLFIVGRSSAPMVGGRKSSNFKEFGPEKDVKAMVDAFKEFGLKPALKSKGSELVAWACTKMNESRKEFFRFACLLFPLAVALDKKREFFEIMTSKNDLSSHDIRLLKDSLGERF